MTIGAVALLAYVAARLAVASPPVPQTRDFGCTEWHQCRELALAAADRGEYETFHDLAWRTVQTGPRNDPALMYLLARAQALSGRPHDALIMLQRLTEMGVASDAATNDDFVRTRQLPGWPDLLARIEGLSHPAAPPPASASTAIPAPIPAPIRAPTPALIPAPTPAPIPAPTPAPSPSPSPTAPPSPPTPEVSRFSTQGFTLGGLAYDAVSRRFLFGDRLGRKLIVVGEGTNHTVDFVRADSAGFGDIAAMEIDGRRGDLWVMSAGLANGAAALHKLQLVSGRPLKSFPIAADPDAVTPVDLAVTPAGVVVALDSAGHQLLVLRSKGTAVERVMRVDAVEPASLAAAGDEGIVYLAYRDGVSRVDLRTRTATKVAAPRSVSLAHLERIRWRPRALIAIRVDADGTRRIVRLTLSASGRAVTKATKIDSPVLPVGGQTFVAISGDELVYLVNGEGSDFNVFRVPLR
jgi:hypothetical protein